MSTSFTAEMNAQDDRKKDHEARLSLIIPELSPADRIKLAVQDHEKRRKAARDEIEAITYKLSEALEHMNNPAMVLYQAVYYLDRSYTESSDHLTEPLRLARTEFERRDGYFQGDTWAYMDQNGSLDPDPAQYEHTKNAAVNLIWCQRFRTLIDRVAELQGTY